MTDWKARARPRGWLLVPLLIFGIYLASFSGYAVIEHRVSVVGEADAASYAILYRSFALGTPAGNPFNVENRSFADVAQKHKLHHVLSAASGRALTALAAPVYRLFGVPVEQAIYLPGALFGALNVLLLGLLLRRQNPHGNSPVPFLLFFGLALSPWAYAAVPDSWPLTTALFLGFLLLAQSERIPSLALAAVLGLCMLNNMALGAAVGVLWLRDWRAMPLGPRLVGRAAAALAIALAVWLAGLLVLSLFDPGYRPDRYWAFSQWFREYMGATLPLTAPYVWKSALSNLFINAVASNQPDPNMPQEAMLYTLKGSRLGLAAIIALAGLLGTAAVRLSRHVAATWRSGGGARAVLTDPAVFPAIWCLVMVLVTLAIYYSGGFTYAALTVPMMAALLARFLDLKRPRERVLVWGAVLLIVLNNLDQVRQWREALAAMG